MKFVQFLKPNFQNTRSIIRWNKKQMPRSHFKIKLAIKCSNVAQIVAFDYPTKFANFIHRNLQYPQIMTLHSNRQVFMIVISIQIGSHKCRKNSIKRLESSTHTKNPHRSENFPHFSYPNSNSSAINWVLPQLLSRTAGSGLLEAAIVASSASSTCGFPSIHKFDPNRHLDKSLTLRAGMLLTFYRYFEAIKSHPTSAPQKLACRSQSVSHPTLDGSVARKDQSLQPTTTTSRRLWGSLGGWLSL